jgi:hypothetical protein
VLVSRCRTLCRPSKTRPWSSAWEGGGERPPASKHEKTGTVRCRFSSALFFALCRSAGRFLFCPLPHQLSFPASRGSRVGVLHFVARDRHGALLLGSVPIWKRTRMPPTCVEPGGGCPPPHPLPLTLCPAGAFAVGMHPLRSAPSNAPQSAIGP